jgi:hypothetical protein
MVLVNLLPAIFNPIYNKAMRWSGDIQDTVSDPVSQTSFPWPLNLYLDDVRETPKGFLRFYGPDEMIMFMAENYDKISTISLDHDLGYDVIGDGYSVLTWLEEMLYFSKTRMEPNIKLHTDNASARVRMAAAIKQIQNITARRGEIDYDLERNN